jgi:alpha-L-rhamnosidase
MTLYDLRVEHRAGPLGLDEKQPRFSWKISSDKKDVLQSAYRIVVSHNSITDWDSGKMQIRQSVLIKYNGDALQPCTAYDVQIEAWDNQGERATAGTAFETGLMDGTAFTAAWITHGLPENETSCPVFCRTFSVDKPVQSVRLYATALGIYECELNGNRVGDAYFAPGWTNYRMRLQYQTYPLDLRQGENRIEFTVANGWYKGLLDAPPKPCHYGDRSALLAEIHIHYLDGTNEIIGTEPGWQIMTGQIRSAEFYMGETIDTIRRKESQGEAVPFQFDNTKIISQESEPVIITQKLPVKECFTSPKGERLLDFGQNLAGFVEVRIKGKSGQTIRLRHGETLDKHGNLYTETLRTAVSIDTFVCNGTEQIFRPHFTFHGFRYVCVEGIDEIQPENFTACVLHTDMKQTGNFSCSNPLVNQLQSNIQWGQRGNSVDIPTDCPQRDERFGWTGDAEVFCATGSFNFDTVLFFGKWLRDLASEQTPEQGVPPTVPSLLNGRFIGIAAWGDAATIVPWEVYEAYGDTRLLERQFGSMKGWVDYIKNQCGPNGLWQTGHQYGDWLSLDKEERAPPAGPGGTDSYLVANAYYLRSTDIVRKAAKLLGLAAEEKKYIELYHDTLTAFQNEYITSTGRVLNETQTACVLVLAFNLAKSEHRRRIVDALVSNLARHNDHLTTGFVGTPYICQVLSENGRHDLAAKLLLQEDYPSWLYAVKKGATTIWERWNSILPSGDFEASGMNSLNHYAYGAIGSWLYRKLGGIVPLESGYRKILIRPMPANGINDIKASLETPYGQVGVTMDCHNGRMTVDVVIPPNTEALICLPGKEEQITAGSGSHHFAYDTDINLDLQRYTMNSLLGDIWENPAAAEIIKKEAPEMYENPMIKYVFKKPLSEVLKMSPQMRPLFEGLIAKLNSAEQQKETLSA